MSRTVTEGRAGGGASTANLSRASVRDEVRDPAPPVQVGDVPVDSPT